MSEYYRVKDLISFDIEIAQAIEDWDSVVHEDLRITCAATSLLNAGSLPWYPMTHVKSGESLDPEIDSLTLGAMCCVIERHALEGHAILTWNGCGFDFRVLIGSLPEGDRRERMARICWENHVDLGFMMVCQLGYMMKLSALADTLESPGKTAGMSGKFAPPLWSPSNSGASEELIAEAEAATGLLCGSLEAQNLCIRYVIQDVEGTKQVGKALERWILDALAGPVIGNALGLHWITGKGTTSKKVWSPQSWVLTDKTEVLFPSVAQCVRTIPEPKWPRGRRDSYYKWLSKYLGEGFAQ